MLSLNWHCWWARIHGNLFSRENTMLKATIVKSCLPSNRSNTPFENLRKSPQTTRQTHQEQQQSLLPYLCPNTGHDIGDIEHQRKREKTFVTAETAGWLRKGCWCRRPQYRQPHNFSSRVYRWLSATQLCSSLGGVLKIPLFRQSGRRMGLL